MARKRLKFIKPIGRRADASRQNGALSNGPVTPEGKAASSMNALKHGFYSEKVIIAAESQDEFNQFRDSFLRRFQPADSAELNLVEEIVLCRWRQRRLWAMEARALDTPEAAAGGRPLEKVLTTYRRLETSLVRQAEAAFRRLQIVQAERREAEANLTIEALEAFCGNEPNVVQPPSYQSDTPAHAPPLAIGA